MPEGSPFAAIGLQLFRAISDETDSAMAMEETGIADKRAAIVPPKLAVGNEGGSGGRGGDQEAKAKGEGGETKYHSHVAVTVALGCVGVCMHQVCVCVYTHHV